MREALKIGDQVEVSVDGIADPMRGEVTGSITTAARQIATVRTPQGNRTMVLDLTGAVGKPPIIVPPVNLQDVRAHALSVLADVGGRMSATLSANMLAVAVIDLTGGVA